MLKEGEPAMSTNSSTLNGTKKTVLQRLPSIDGLLSDPRIDALTRQYPKKRVIDEIRIHLKGVRRRIMQQEEPRPPINVEDIITEFVEKGTDILPRNFQRAINATGIILHDALGRAPYSASTQEALSNLVNHYCTLQIDPESGKPASRQIHVEKILQKLTGAESAMIVNNHAASILLILNTLSGGKEILISRSELMESGDAFRILDLIKTSGAKLAEIGTTNRTRLEDYRGGLRSGTGIILSIHHSNYRITGATTKVKLEDLVELSHGNGTPVVFSLESGALIDLTRWGISHEPRVQDAIRAGADLVCFGGDGLIGGPQCGIIVGSQKIIDRLRKNHLLQAIRCDKMTFAVLEATLRLFLDEENLITSHPVLKMLTESANQVKKRCQTLKRRLSPIIGDRGWLQVTRDLSQAGTETLAAESLPTYTLAVRIMGIPPKELDERLRQNDPPIFGRVNENRYLIDCRTVRRDEFTDIVNAFQLISDAFPKKKMKQPSGDDFVEEILKELDENENGEDPLFEIE